MAKRRSFKRPLGKRRYKQMFVIAAEGAKTEPLYFKMLDTVNSVVHFKCLKNRDRSAPSYVLKKMMEYIVLTGVAGNNQLGPINLPHDYGRPVTITSIRIISFSYPFNTPDT